MYLEVFVKQFFCSCFLTEPKPFPNIIQIYDKIQRIRPSPRPISTSPQHNAPTKQGTGISSKKRGRAIADTLKISRQRTGTVLSSPEGSSPEGTSPKQSQRQIALRRRVRPNTILL